MAEQKDFFFKFFAREFLTSKEVRELSLEDQAILVRLWCVCCLEGVLPEDLEELSMASGVKQMFLHKFEHLFEQFFKRGDTGHRFSPRMERERERTRRTSDARSEAGKASGEARRRKKEIDLIDSQTNKCSNKCSNKQLNSQSHSKEEKNPTQESEINGGTRTPKASTGADSLVGGALKHSRSAGFEIPEIEAAS